MDIGDFQTTPVDIKRFNFCHGLASGPKSVATVHRFSPSVFFDNWQLIRNNIFAATKNNNSLVDKYQKIKQILRQAQLTDRTLSWSNYAGNKVPADLSTLREKGNNKHNVIYDTIMDRKPKTLADLGCNAGRFSFLAESVGTKVVGIDKYSMIVEKANKMAASRNANCVFLRYDVMNPPHKGYEVDEDINIRLGSEGVLAAALIHHLYWAGYKIEDIIKVLSSYATKWLLVEIITAEDKFVKHTVWAKKWFTLEQVQDLLKQEGWKSIKVMDSSPTPRKWILCEK